MSGVDDGFLVNMDLLTHRPKQVQPLQPYPKGGQCRPGRKTI